MFLKNNKCQVLLHTFDNKILTFICSRIMRNKKDLYMASCMDELMTKTTLPNGIKNLDLLSYVQNIHYIGTISHSTIPTLSLSRYCVLYRLSKRAFIVYNEAMKWNNENDEEHVYIFLMKYCEILQLMRNFKTDEKYTSLMHANNLKKALKMLTYIKESLEKR